MLLGGVCSFAAAPDKSNITDIRMEELQGSQILQEALLAML